MKDWTGNKKSAFTTIGAAGHANHARQSEDYYATEPKATELLCELEQFSHDVWEPACGEGHMVKVLQSKGYNVRASDLIDRGGGYEIYDFLDMSNMEWNGDIITNPPYRYAKEFVEKAMSVIPKGHKVAMFLKLTFLERRYLELSLRRLYMCQAVGLNVLLMEILRNLAKVQQPMLGFSGRKDIKEIR